MAAQTATIFSSRSPGMLLFSIVVLTLSAATAVTVGSVVLVFVLPPLVLMLRALLLLF